MNIYAIYRKYLRVINILNTMLVKTEIKDFGKGSRFLPGSYIAGGERIKIGAGTIVNKHVMLTAQYVEGVTKEDIIIEIGDRCGIGPFSHITGIKKIRIGNCVRTGANILITDNSHGSFIREQLDISPRERPLISNGEVIIEDNVWIGEKSSILPGVHIGRGSVIGANSVVTKDVPPYSMAVGAPAKIIKHL